MTEKTNRSKWINEHLHAKRKCAWAHKWLMLESGKWYPFSTFFVAIFQITVANAFIPFEHPLWLHIQMLGSIIPVADYKMILALFFLCAHLPTLYTFSSDTDEWNCNVISCIISEWISKCLRAVSKSKWWNRIRNSTYRLKRIATRNLIENLDWESYICTCICHNFHRLHCKTISVKLV